MLSPRTQRPVSNIMPLALAPGYVLTRTWTLTLLFLIATKLDECFAVGLLSGLLTYILLGTAVTVWLIFVAVLTWYCKPFHCIWKVPGRYLGKWCRKSTRSTGCTS